MKPFQPMSVLEEYTKENNIKYDFLLAWERSEIDMIAKSPHILYMMDSNNKVLQFEEIDDITAVLMFEENLIPIARRLIREQILKELGI